MWTCKMALGLESFSFKDVNNPFENIAHLSLVNMCDVLSGSYC